MDRPEEYRWSSLGYRFRSSRKDGFLSWNLGLNEYSEIMLRMSLREFHRVGREFFRQGELFQDIIRPKRERKPHRILGLHQVYSLQRLT